MRELDIDLRADESAPRVSRTRLDEMAADLGSRLLDVKLIVSELVTNSVRHSANPQTVRVRVRSDQDTIRVEVVDEGPGFPPDPNKSDGLGLTIVGRLADKWGVHVDGTCTVWVELSQSLEEKTSD